MHLMRLRGGQSQKYVKETSSVISQNVYVSLSSGEQRAIIESKNINDGCD